MKKINTTDGNTKLVILDETLWSKEICKVKTKKSLYDFTDADVNMRRDKAVLIFQPIIQNCLMNLIEMIVYIL